MILNMNTKTNFWSLELGIGKTLFKEQGIQRISRTGFYTNKLIHIIIDTERGMVLFQKRSKICKITVLLVTNLKTPPAVE